MHWQGEIRARQPVSVMLPFAHAHEWRLNSTRLEAVFISFGGFKCIEFSLQTDWVQAANGLGAEGKLYGHGAGSPEKQQGMLRKTA